jgi:type II secretory pathway component HofQ
VVFSATPVSSTNKTDRHDITEILLKVALNTINQTKPIFIKMKIIDILSIMQIKGSRVTLQVPLVEEELLTLLEHLSSPRFLVGFMLLGF